MKKIYLDKNEMPYLPPKKVRASIRDTVKTINRYTPQNVVDKLITSLSEYSDIERDAIFLSSGSDLIIKEFIFLFSKNRQVIIADPTFIIIENAAANCFSPLLKIKLSEPDFSFPAQIIEDELNKPTLLVLDNPNNPTGASILKEEQIKALLRNNNLIILIDEAYFEFCGNTFIPLVNQFSNLAVVRTLSKSFGLAGAGIGYLIAGDTIRGRLEGLEVMLPYPSVVGALSALNHQDYMIEYVDHVKKEKKRILYALKDLGIHAYPSETNFILMKTNIQNIAYILAENGVYVSDVSQHYPSEYIRVTIGTVEENDYFLQVLGGLVNKTLHHSI